MKDDVGPLVFPKRALLTGATGLVGKALVEKIRTKSPQTEIRILTRSALPSIQIGCDHVKAFQWAPSKGQIDPAAIAGVDCVIHLAGETVAQRWSPSVRRNIRTSRIDALHLIRSECEKQQTAPRVLSASAIGGYPSNDAEQNEKSQFGEGFIEDVVRDWEQAVRQLGELGGGNVCLRIGLVLSPNGGVLERLLPLYKFGLGSPLAPGTQWQSWIHIHDLTDLFVHAMLHPKWSGAYNAVSPYPVQQRDFSQNLAKALSRPHFLPAVPQFALQLLFGEAAHSLLASHRISPQRTLASGFVFEHPELGDALNALLRPNPDSDIPNREPTP